MRATPLGRPSGGEVDASGQRISCGKRPNVRIINSWSRRRCGSESSHSSFGGSRKPAVSWARTSLPCVVSVMVLVRRFILRVAARDEPTAFEPVHDARHVGRVAREGVGEARHCARGDRTSAAVAGGSAASSGRTAPRPQSCAPCGCGPRGPSPPKPRQLDEQGVCPKRTGAATAAPAALAFRLVPVPQLLEWDSHSGGSNTPVLPDKPRASTQDACQPQLSTS